MLLLFFVVVANKTVYFELFGENKNAGVQFFFSGEREPCEKTKQYQQYNRHTESTKKITKAIELSPAKTQRWINEIRFDERFESDTE